MVRFFKLLSFNPWPFCSSLSSMFFLFSLVLLFFGGQKKIFAFIRFVLLVTTLFFWFYEVVGESFNGGHNSFMNEMFNFRMIMFIISEICFFFRFFWAFFYKSVNPLNWERESRWPPFNSVDRWGVPFLNTLILLSSGVSLTWAHHCLISLRKNYDLLIVHLGLILTLGLGISFELLQFEEYCANFFSINSTAYGRTFYMLTGFHGFHVLMGLIILFVSWLRLVYCQFNKWTHNNLLLGAWYWHFVDVVWLFLFIFVYVSFQTV